MPLGRTTGAVPYRLMTSYHASGRRLRPAPAPLLEEENLVRGSSRQSPTPDRRGDERSCATGAMRASAPPPSRNCLPDDRSRRLRVPQWERCPALSRRPRPARCRPQATSPPDPPARESCRRHGSIGSLSDRTAHSSHGRLRRHGYHRRSIPCRPSAGSPYGQHAPRAGLAPEPTPRSQLPWPERVQCRWRRARSAARPPGRAEAPPSSSLTYSKIGSTVPSRAGAETVAATSNHQI